MTKLDAGLSELKFQSLGDQATEHIRDLIIRGDLAPNVRLPEETLASAMGVSRACVREAFLRLESEGLVRRERNKYTEVVRFTKKDATEILALRGAIEVLAVETCIASGNIPVEQLREQVEVIAGRCGDADIEALMVADLDFHEIIVKASGNSRAIGIWHHLKSQMKVLLFAALGNDQNPTRFSGKAVHGPIVDALEARNMEKAISLIKQHVGDSTLASTCIDMDNESSEEDNH